MKIIRRIWMGLAALAVILPLALVVTPAHSAQAASSYTSNPKDIKSCIQNLTFINISEIDCTFKPVGQTKSITVKFINPNSDAANNGCSDNNPFNGCANNLNFAQQGDFFINGPESSTGCAQSNCANLPGITVQGPGTNDRIKGPLTQDNAGKPLNLFVNLQYHDTRTGQALYPCEDFSNSCSDSKRYSKDHLPNTDAVGPIMKGAKTDGLKTLLHFNGQNADSLDTVAQGVLSGRSYGLDATYKASPILVFTSNFSPNPCSGDVLIVTKLPSDEGVTIDSAKEFVLNNSNQNLASDYPNLLAYLNSKDASGCGIASGGVNFYDTNTAFAISGTVPKLSGGSGNGGGGGGG